MHMPAFAVACCVLPPLNPWRTQRLEKMLNKHLECIVAGQGFFCAQDVIWERALLHGLLLKPSLSCGVGRECVGYIELSCVYTIDTHI